MKINKNAAQVVSLFVLGCALIIVYKVFDNVGAIGGVIAALWSIMMPFIVGFGIAFLLWAPVNWMDGKLRTSHWTWVQRAARPLSVAVVYITALALLTLIVYIAVPALVNTIRDFLQADYIKNFTNDFNAFLADISEDGGLLSSLDIKKMIDGLVKAIGDFFSPDMLKGYVSGVVSFATGLVDIVMAFIVSVYMLLGKESLIRASKSVSGLIIKPGLMNVFSVYSHKIARIFYNYFYSQIIDAFVVSVLTTIGLLIVGLPNGMAPALGVLLGILNMIPYFGALIGGVLCTFVALITVGPYHALFVAVYILVMQQIDANIIQPRIVGHTVGIRPIYVLLGITLFGGLFGFWGVFLGAPFIAVIQMILRDCIEAKNNKKDTIKESEE